MDDARRASSTRDAASSSKGDGGFSLVNLPAIEDEAGGYATSILGPSRVPLPPASCKVIAGKGGPLTEALPDRWSGSPTLSIFTSTAPSRSSSFRFPHVQRLSILTKYPRSRRRRIARALPTERWPALQACIGEGRTPSRRSSCCGEADRPSGREYGPFAEYPEEIVSVRATSESCGVVTYMIAP